MLNTKTCGSNSYYVNFLQQGCFLFRNCPSELPPEKFGWMKVIQELNREQQTNQKRLTIVTDHDLDNHTPYNNKTRPIFREFYLPDNFILTYGRGDGPKQGLLNYLVKQCDKTSSKLLNEIEGKGYCQHGDKR